MKKKIILALVILLLGLMELNAQVAQQWVSMYNGTNNGHDNSSFIATDNSGNVYVTGWSTGTAEDYCTIKYNSSGLQLWVARYNGPGNGKDIPSGIAVDNIGNVYITGYSVGNGTGDDYCTIKYNSSGVQQWVARYHGIGSSYDHANGIAVDNNGNVCVTGSSYSDMYTIKYNSFGTVLWDRRWGGDDLEQGKGIAIDNNGDVYVTGNQSYLEGNYILNRAFTYKFNSSSGEFIWIRWHEGNSEERVVVPVGIKLDNNDNVYIITREWWEDYNGHNDINTVKYNSSGDRQWAATYNHPGYSSEPTGISIDNFGNVYVAGFTMIRGNYNSCDYCTIKYNSSGIMQWAKLYNGPGNSNDSASGIAVASGYIYVTGRSSGTGTNLDYCTVKYNTLGDQILTLRYNGPVNNVDIADGIVVDKDDNILITGAVVGSSLNRDFCTIKYVQYPKLISPLNNATNILLGGFNLMWESVTGASSYKVQISSNPGFPQGQTNEFTVTGNNLYQLPQNYLQQGTMYYWRVNFTIGQTTSSWSPIWNFTTGSAPPAPALIYPGNGAMNVSLTPNLTWNGVTNCNNYEIQVWKNATPTVLVLRDTIDHSVTNYNVPSGMLNYNTQYYWRIGAINQFGQVFSSSNVFTTLVPPVPPAIRLISPANNATNVDVAPKLDWADTVYTTLYQVQISTTSGFNNIILDTTVNPSYIFVPNGKLAFLTYYYWRVRGYNISGPGPWSSIWNFKTGNTSPPSQAPQLTGPANNSANVSLTGMFWWGVVPNATGYRIMISSDSSFGVSAIKVDTLISGNQYDLPPGKLMYYTKYFWRVYGRNLGGYSPSSAIWSFTTLPPPAPTLVSPPNMTNTSNQNVTFVWNAVPYIISYNFQLAMDPNFNNIYLDLNNIPSPGLLSIGIPYNGYYWRVRAKGTNGYGSFSLIWVLNVSGLQQISEQIPTEYKLYNNFPNPFNPVTNIKFDLPKSSNVKLAVYDIQGRQIEILVNEKLSAGVYKADFNAGRLSSGVYIYRLITEDYTATKRMILVK